MRILEEKHDVNAALFMVTLKGQAGPLQPFTPSQPVSSDQWGKDGGGRGDSGSGGQGPPLGGHKSPSWPKEPRLGEGGDRFWWAGAARGPQVSILSGVRMCPVRYSRPVFTVPCPCGPSYHETAPRFPALSFPEGRTFQREDLRKLGSQSWETICCIQIVLFPFSLGL